MKNSQLGIYRSTPNINLIKEEETNDFNNYSGKSEINNEINNQNNYDKEINTSNIFMNQVIKEDKNNDILIINNYFNKCNEYYQDANEFIRQKSFNEALALLDKIDSAFNSLYSVISNKNEPYIPNIKEKIINYIDTVKKRKQFCQDEINKKLVIIPSYYKTNIDNKPMRSSTMINNNKNNKESLEKTELPKNKVNIVGADIKEKIRTEILINSPNVKFNDIIGLESIKQTLKEIIVIPNLRPDLFTGIRSPPRGLLLFGPPGTGKTLIAKAVATECKSTFFSISSSSLTSKYVGESEKLVRALFEEAFSKQPSIIFIDEIEAILSKRTDSDGEGEKRLKTEFLIQFDGVSTNLNDRVLIIGATNRPQDLDPAVLRRLPKRVYIGPLDLNGRILFIENILKNVENVITNKEVLFIAKSTEIYSNSDLKELCREAAYAPLRQLKQNELEKIKKLRPITLEDFKLALRKIRGTLTDQMLRDYLKWNSEYGEVLN